MIYIIITLILILLELGYFKVAAKLNIIDKPNKRSSHSALTLRGGGIIFVFSTWIFWVISGFEYSWFMLGLTLLGIVSFIDDIHCLPSSLRLLTQMSAVALMFSQLGLFGNTQWWLLIILGIAAVGIINAYNFMDGINGITGSYSLAVLLPLIYLNLYYNFISSELLLITVISLLVFCFFNFRKRAKCFAGDVGSISMAFIILFALGSLIQQTGDFSYIVFLAVYGVDVVMTILHRIILHDELGRAHRKHAYQLMVNELKLPHLMVSTLYMSLQLLISLGRLTLSINPYLYLVIVLIVLSVAYILFMKKYYRLHEAYLKSR